MRNSSTLYRPVLASVVTNCLFRTTLKIRLQMETLLPIIPLRHKLQSYPVPLRLSNKCSSQLAVTPSNPHLLQARVKTPAVVGGWDRTMGHFYPAQTSGSHPGDFSQLRKLATESFSQHNASVGIIEVSFRLFRSMLHKLTNSVAPEPEGSSPYPQGPATGPYPDPTGSNLHSPSQSP
jgi:hypothetical protein